MIKQVKKRHTVLGPSHYRGKTRKGRNKIFSTVPKREDRFGDKAKRGDRRKERGEKTNTVLIKLSGGGLVTGGGRKEVLGGKEQT